MEAVGRVAVVGLILVDSVSVIQKKKKIRWRYFGKNKSRKLGAGKMAWREKALALPTC